MTTTYYTRGFEHSVDESSIAMTTILLSALALILTFICLAITEFCRTEFAKTGFIGAAIVFGILFGILFLIALIALREEDAKDKREWKTVTRIGGYRYDQSLTNAKLRRAVYVVRVEYADQADYPVNFKWLDHGGYFNTADMEYSRFR